MKKRKHGQQIPRPTKKQERRGIVIPAEQWKRIQSEAKKNDISASRFIRRAIETIFRGVKP